MAVKSTPGLIILLALLALVAGVLIYYGKPLSRNGTSLPPAEKPGLIRLSQPRPNDVIASPLTLTGEARGNWFFEASFPVRLLDGNGRELAAAPAQAQREWMSAEFVPFHAELAFTAPATAGGTLVLEKDNPSGLPEHADELRIPVRFR